MSLASLGPIDEKWSLNALDKSDDSDIEVPFRFIALIDELTALPDSITSRCSRKEPALLPRAHGWTRGDSFVSLSQSDIRPEIFVGHKLSQQF